MIIAKTTPVIPIQNPIIQLNEKIRYSPITKNIISNIKDIFSFKFIYIAYESNLVFIFKSL